MVKNPQANSICKQMHQTIGYTLRSMYSLHPPDGVQTAEQMVDTAIANALCVHKNREWLIDRPFLTGFEGWNISQMIVGDLSYWFQHHFLLL